MKCFENTKAGFQKCFARIRGTRTEKALDHSAFDQIRMIMILLQEWKLWTSRRRNRDRRFR